MHWFLVALLCSGGVPSDSPEEPHEDSPVFAPLFAIRGKGIGTGNFSYFSGLRLNLVDIDVRRVNGINLTLGWPTPNPKFLLRGLNIGALTTRVGRLYGMTIGGLWTDVEREAIGFQIGGILNTSNGPAGGLALGGLVNVTKSLAIGVRVAGLVQEGEDHLGGVHVSGLWTRSKGAVVGVGGAGLALMSEKVCAGIQVSGLFTQAEGPIAGAHVAGLLLQSRGALAGLNVGGLACLAERSVYGLAIGGLTLQTGCSNLVGRWSDPDWLGEDGDRVELVGAGISGLRVMAPSIRGFALGGLMVRTRELTGLCIGTYNQIEGPLVGASIGVVNVAKQLNGFQIGVFNYVEENPWPFKLVPILNYSP